MNTEITTKPEDWSLIIRPQRTWWDLRLGELWRYRDLIWLFVWRDFVAVYKQTILGPLWYIIPSILTTGVFTIIFGNIAGLPTDGLPPFLFYMCGETIWSYFSACASGTSNTFGNNAGIFGKIYFPRLSVPISLAISSLILFGIRFIVFLLFLAYFGMTGAAIRPNLWMLILPVLLLIAGGLGLSLGIIVSSLTIKYRDLQKIVGFGIQLLMYSSPIIYPFSSVAGVWRWLLLANPMTPIIEIFRLAFLGESSLDPIYLVYSAAFMMILLFSGIVIFQRVEASFMDTV